MGSILHNVGRFRDKEFGLPIPAVAVDKEKKSEVPKSQNFEFVLSVGPTQLIEVTIKEVHQVEVVVVLSPCTRNALLVSSVDRTKDRSFQRGEVEVLN